jgi:hypothetical protein
MSVSVGPAKPRADGQSVMKVRGHLDELLAVPCYTLLIGKYQASGENFSAANLFGGSARKIRPTYSEKAGRGQRARRPSSPPVTRALVVCAIFLECCGGKVMAGAADSGAADAADSSAGCELLCSALARCKTDVDACRSSCSKYAGSLKNSAECSNAFTAFVQCQLQYGDIWCDGGGLLTEPVECYDAGNLLNCTCWSC